MSIAIIAVAHERTRRGQGTVEFALTATVCGVLMGGLMEFGRAFSAAQLLTAAARDGARAAVVVQAANRVSVATARVRSTAASYFAPGDLTVTVTSGLTASAEPIVTVAVQGRFTPLFGNSILPTTDGLFRFSRTATMRDEIASGP
jgi:Flp pilus assembly protein TadG